MAAPLTPGHARRLREGNEDEMSTDGHTAQTQRRNRYSFDVTWPAEMPADHPSAALAGTSYRVSYPTPAAMDLAARGFTMQGATIR